MTHWGLSFSANAVLSSSSSGWTGASFNTVVNKFTWQIYFFRIKHFNILIRLNSFSFLKHFCHQSLPGCTGVSFNTLVAHVCMVSLKGHSFVFLCNFLFIFLFRQFSCHFSFPGIFFGGAADTELVFGK